MDIILAIKPEWAAKIYSGEKIVEWRKTKPKNFRECDDVILYETAPVKKINGFLKLYGIIKINPENLSKRHPLIKYGFIDKKDLEKYAGGKTVYALLIKHAEKFTPSGEELKKFGVKKDPQSWVYCKNWRDD